MTEHCSCTMLISIENMDGGLSGHIFNCCLRRPVPFKNIRELVFRIAGIAGLLNVPGFTAEYRTISGCRDTSLELLPKEYQEILPLDCVPGDSNNKEFYRIKTKEVFYLHLVGRQHMSLQGRLKGRMTRGQYVYFRSALELMIMLSAMEVK